MTIKVRANHVELSPAHFQRETHLPRNHGIFRVPSTIRLLARSCALPVVRIGRSASSAKDSR